MNDLKRSATSSLRRTMAVGQARVVLLGAVIAAMFAAVGVLHAWTRVGAVREGYRLSQAELKHRELRGEHERLKMERNTLKSATRLESLARTTLGMAPPTSGQLISLSDRRPALAPDKTVASVAREPKNTSTP
ncbi:MAG: cell division protein FtsL [Myxococcales bacterium]